MTQIITRYFDSAANARAATNELIQYRRVSAKIVRLYETGNGLAENLAEKSVDPATAAAYQDRMASGGAVVLVEAGYQPLGVAQMTREVVAEKGAADMGGLTEEVYVKERLQPTLSILDDHRRIMTRPRDPDSTNYYMADWPIPLISRRKPWNDSLFPRHARMANWPIDLLVPGHKFMANFPIAHLIPGHKYMAKFPFAHIVPGHKYMANFPFGHIVPGHKFMANFPFAHIVPGHKFMANFPFGHLVPGGRRMANWPFPLLINGKQHTNSLVPGHKYMAKFPFAHIVPGHKYMANFPFGHIVPNHKYMANFIWPHTKPGSTPAAS